MNSSQLCLLMTLVLLGSVNGSFELRAQSPSFEGQPVVALTYEPTKQPITPDDLRALQSLQVGQPLSGQAVSSTIDKLFATGHYDDIQVDAEPRGNGVAVKFITKPTFFVGHIEVVGNVKDPPNRGQIINQAQLALGTPFDPAALSAAKHSIQRLLISNGLYESDVDVQSQTNQNTQQVSVTITVDPGKRAKYTTPVIKGDTKLPNSTIVRATGWQVRLVKRWREVTQGLTETGIEGIRKKYQSKDRLAATAEIESLDYDEDTRRVTPTIRVEGGPKITVKALEAKVSKSRLKRYVPIYQEGAVDRDLLVEGARNLRDYFQGQGYPDVDVTFRQQPLKNDQQEIEYFITRGKRQKLAQLDIQGVNYFRQETIRERMFLLPASFQYRHGRYSESFLRKDEEAIGNLYKANGFRDVQVSSSVVNNFKGKDGQIAVTFKVDEGQQWFISDLQTEGFQQLDPQKVLPSLVSAVGQPYSDVNIASDRNAVVTAYLSQGFPQSTFQYKTSPGAAPNEVAVKYQVNEGPREFVRGVLVSGLRNTKRKMVRDALGVQPGAPLSLVAVNDAQRRLYDLGIFARINTAVQGPEGALDHKYVLYDFEEANRYTLNLGLGLELAQIGGTTTDINAPTGNGGIRPRFSIDARRLNFLGVGHTVALSGRFSTLQQRASINYLIPRFLGSPNRSFTVSGIYDLSRNVRTFASKRQELNFQVSQKVSRSTTFFLRYAFRNVSTSGVIIPTLLVPALVQPIRIGIVSFNLVQDRRDDPADPHRGVYNSVDLGFASNALGSQRQFGRALVRNSTYNRIGSKFVFARQLTFGVVQPITVEPGLTSANTIPLPERFFGGGTNSHRGFAENQAGPRDIGEAVGTDGLPSQSTGFPLGGNAILFHNSELRFPLIGDNIGGVLFHDIGNVYRSIGDISFRYTQRDNLDFNYAVNAVGFGIRYKTPIGPLRGDLAHSLNPPRYEGFGGTQVQLLQCDPRRPPNELPPFCTPTQQRLSRFQFFFSIGQTF